jgi:hypothetical protein
MKQIYVTRNRWIPVYVFDIVWVKSKTEEEGVPVRRLNESD